VRTGTFLKIYFLRTGSGKYRKYDTHPTLVWGPPRGGPTDTGLATLRRRRVSGFKFQPWENLGYP